MHTPAHHLTTSDGTRIAHRDHTPEAGTSADPVLLLHGLAGHQGEWNDLVPRLLADGHRVVTYDARGHGDSTRHPRTTTRAAHVQDAVTLIEDLSLAPAILIGQSLGGHTALLLASAHPDLVKSLILIEAGPGGPNPKLPAEIAGWLDSWPTPFPSREAAQHFLGGQKAWADGLEEREDGWYPRFDRDTMIDSISELATTAYWTDWSRITAPTLLVRGQNGTVPPQEATDMLTRRPQTQDRLIPDAGHDVHLDQPDALYEAIRSFLLDLGPT
ncbi:alpha/beta hydrolase [Streptomyces sp. S.PNR 29]|uniref:alpha/beta fold hydrolase n=1 Tax=Streptomyces sp. S.PNR 29 TaxID=2973805 RepID=UPI0025AF40F8|nr:alpha/beta hydrolase [Streptomyces sp. S.PNR 29]MDN0197083.1 alpha/beta hydrolase [Streptomyces sp. S.PNR 29]